MHPNIPQKKDDTQQTYSSQRYKLNGFQCYCRQKQLNTNVNKIEGKHDLGLIHKHPMKFIG